MMIYGFGLSERPNFWIREFFFRLHARFFNPPHSLKEIVLVGLDDRSLKDLKIGWPVPRRIFAEVIEKIQLDHPQMVILDYVIVGPSSFGPEDDQAMQSAVGKLSKMMLPLVYSPEGDLLLPFKPYQRLASGVGSVVHHAKLDGKIHDFNLIELNPQGKILAFSLAALSAFTYQGIDLNQVRYENNRLVLPNGTDIVLGTTRELSTFFYKQKSDFQHISFADFLEDERPPIDLKNKIVILGYESPLFHDIAATPLGLMSGFVLVANEILTLLEGQYIYIVPYSYQFGFWIIFATLLFALFRSLSWGRAVFACGIIPLLILLISFGSFKSGIWFDFFIPWVGLISSFMVEIISRLVKKLQSAYAEKLKSEKMAVAGEIMARFSHEIKNPLANMRSALALLKKNVVNDLEASKWVLIFDEEVQRISKLSMQMLSFFRPQEERKVIYSANDLIREMIELSRNKLKEARIHLILDLDDDLPNVFVAPNQIKQVILNLIINALDAMEGLGGTLNIQTRSSHKNFVQIRIEDTGPGILKAHHQKLFQPFFTTKDQGIGLGLSNSYDIVHRNGGFLELDPAYSKGAAFNIKLPIVE